MYCIYIKGLGYLKETPDGYKYTYNECDATVYGKEKLINFIGSGNIKAFPFSVTEIKRNSYVAAYKKYRRLRARIKDIVKLPFLAIINLPVIIDQVSNGLSPEYYEDKKMYKKMVDIISGLKKYSIYKRKHCTMIEKLEECVSNNVMMNATCMTEEQFTELKKYWAPFDYLIFVGKDCCWHYTKKGWEKLEHEGVVIKKDIDNMYYVYTERGWSIIE